MVDWTKPIQFRNGIKLDLLCKDYQNGKGTPYVVRSRDDESGEDMMWFRDASGICPGCPDRDVINRPERIVRHLHVFAARSYNKGFRANWEDAYMAKDETRAGVIRVEAEDGKIVAVSLEKD